MSEAASSRARLAILAAGFLTLGAAKLAGSLGDAPLFRTPWVFYGALVLTGAVGAATVLSALFPRRQTPLVPFVITLLAGALAWLIRPGAVVAA